MSSDDSPTMTLRCYLFGHVREFTEEYENKNGHVQADRVCVRCGDRELAWTGPERWRTDDE